MLFRSGMKFSTSEFRHTRSEMSTAGKQAKRRQSEREKEQTRQTSSVETDIQSMKELCAAMITMTQIITSTVAVLAKMEIKTDEEVQLFKKMDNCIQAEFSAVGKGMTKTGVKLDENQCAKRTLMEV